jgi:hypothetical protein
MPNVFNTRMFSNPTVMASVLAIPYSCPDGNGVGFQE